jgi:hypothetical protein
MLIKRVKLKKMPLIICRCWFLLCPDVGAGYGFYVASVAPCQGLDNNISNEALRTSPTVVKILIAKRFIYHHE